MSEKEDKERILIVDDDEDTCKSLSLILGRKGYGVDIAGTGEEALEKIKKSPFDLVLLDIKLPDADGIELIAPLKEPNPDTEIVVTTGYASVENAVQALNKGAAAYLTKPLNMDEVLATIGNILAKQRLVREKQRVEERIEYLNAVLRAIRNVNQLIIREGDRPRLLKGICDNLTETRGYYSCWAALIDDSGALVTCAESGLGKDFKAVAEQLKKGKLPQCAERAMKKTGVILAEDSQQDCKDCPLAAKYEGRGAMVVRLAHEGRVYGLLAVSVPAHVTVDEEELSLFREVTGDIAFALHGIEQEEQRERAEEELRASKEFSDNILDSMQDGLSVLDKDGVHIEVNTALCDMTGFPREELIGVGPPHPYWAPEAMDDIEITMKKTLCGDLETFELTFMRKNGERFPAIISPSCIRDRNGDIEHFMATVKDITERKRAEDQIVRMSSMQNSLNTFMLKQSEINDYEQLVKTIATQADQLLNPIATVFNEYDQDAKVLRIKEIKANQGVLALFAKIAGKSIFSTDTPVNDEMYEEMKTARIKIASTLHQVSAGAVSKTVSSTLGKALKIKSFVGFSYIVDDQVFGTTVVALEEEPDRFAMQLLGSYAHFTSISLKRVIAEQALRESEENYRTVFEGTMDGLIVIDAETLKIVLANDAVLQLYGFDPDADLSRINPLDYVHPDDRERALRTILEDMFQEDLRQINEFRVYTNQGEEKWVSTLGSVIDCQGRKAGLVSFRDITVQKQAEEALRSSEGKLRAMFDAITDGIFTINMEGRVVELNEAAFRMPGYSSREELIGANVFDFVAEKDRERAANDMMKSISEGTAVRNAEYTLMKKDGSTFDCEMSAAMLKDAFDNPVGFIAVERDVTPRKLAEEALRESEERYRRLVESSPHGIQVIDTGGVITFANPAYQKMLGYTEEELLGESVLNLLEPIAKRDELRNYLHYLVKEQPSPTTYNQQNRAKDGRIIDMAVDWDYNRDEQGHVTGFLSVITDITEQKRAQEALRESEERYRTLFEEAPACIAVVDTSGVIVNCNDEIVNISGYTRDEVTGKRFDELLTLDSGDLPDTEQDFRDIIGGKRASIQTLGIIRKDGQRRWLSIRVAPLQSGGKVYGILIYAVDVTQRRQAEEELQESEAKYSAVVEQSQTAVIIVQDYVFTFVNQAAAKLSGYSRDELIGMKISRLFAPRLRELMDEMYRQRMEGEEVPPLYESQIRRKDGALVDVEISASIIDYRGKPADVALIYDITERKRAEEEIKRHAQRETNLRQITQAISQTMDMNEMLDNVLHRVCEVEDATIGAIFVLDLDTGEVVLRAHTGVSESFVNSMGVLKLSGAEMKRMLEWRGKALQPEKVFDRINAARVAEAVKREGLQWHIILPFWSKGIPMGALTLGDLRHRRLSKDAEDLLVAIGSEIAVGIDNIHLLERTMELSSTDELTGLYNRRHFYDVLEAEMARTARYKRPFTLVLLDLDGFKEYNDRFGHLNGDAVLKSLGQTLKSTLRKSDTSFRYGGDEFAIILAGTGSQRAKGVIERIRMKWLQTPKARYPMLETPLGFSAGIAQFPEHADTADGLVFMADSALYHAKQGGGYRVVVASDLESLSPEILETATPDHVYALASTVDAKDPYTYGHSKNVADIACKIGIEIGMSAKELADLRNVSLLHDIGKLGVPDAILTKPGKLTREECEIVKRHSADGERIVSYVKDLSPLVHMIRHHHEWYDGSGYPDGLKGEAIPLGARIITIADAYDTMTGRRPYREPVSPSEALEELVRCSGTQFDPNLVEAFIGLSREHK